MFDWFTQWFDRILHGFVAQMLWGHAGWVDWFTLVFVVLGVIYGLQNGLLAELAEITQIMIVIYLVLEHYRKLEKLLLTYATYIPRESAAGVAYIVMALAVWIIAVLITRYLQRFFHADLARPLKLTGGAILGGLHLFIIFSFLCQAVLLLPVRQPKKAFEKGMSYTGYSVAHLAPTIHGMIGNPARIFTGN